MSHDDHEGTFHGHRIPEGEEPAWVDHPRNVTLVFRAVMVAWFLSIAAAFLPYERHAYFAFESMPFFQALYGLGCCIGLVLGARWMRTYLMRSEDYYDDE